jgi:ABC-type Mn2+/Zn2+ transport system ATPase subunit
VSAASVLVDVRRAELAYDAEPVLAVSELQIAAGELVGLLGPSGAGKTTLLRALLGQLRPRRGEVLVHGRPARRGAHRIGYVPQVDTVDWSFPVTVGEVVQMGRAAEAGPWPWSRRADRVDRSAILARLGIGALERRHIRELSGGQQQRVFLARALVRRPDLLLLDEPTSGVDAATRREIVELLRDQQRAGMAVVLTTHDLNGVAAQLPRLVALNGVVVADGSPRELFTTEVLRATFGAEMIVLTHEGLRFAADLPTGHRGSEHVHHAHVHHGAPHAEPVELSEVG